MMTDPRFPWLNGPTASPDWIKQGRDYEAAHQTGVPDRCMLADEPDCTECDDTGFVTHNIRDIHGVTVAHELPCGSCDRSDDFWRRK